MTLERLWAGWRARYVSEEAGKLDTCFLCALDALPEADAISDRTLVLERTATTVTVMNLYPYGSGHLLISPRRHEGALDALTELEAQELMAALRRAAQAINDAYGCDGINFGANQGLAAGAGLPDHLHFHALPRWSGDTNFMAAIAETRVVPESLETGWAKLHKAWPAETSR